MLDEFYRKIIDSSHEGYALIKLNYDKDDLICNFNFIFSNPIFKKLIDNNCDLNPVISNYINDMNFNFSNNQTHQVEWTCKTSNLNYGICLSFLDKDHIILNINHSISKENLPFDYCNDFLCDCGNKSNCKLEKSEKKYKLLFESMYECFALHKIILDENNKPIDYVFLDVNSSFERTTGLKRDEILGMRISDIISCTLDATNMCLIEDFGKVALTGDKVSFEYHAKEINKIFQIKAFSPEKYIFAVTFVDITNLRELEESLKEDMHKIEFLSYCDQLTSLYNRRFFEDSLNKLDTKESLPLTVIMIDVNGLKLANDAFGHSMGDRLLVEVSKILREPFTKDDIVARLGGDEFAVLLPRTDSNAAKRLVDEIKSLSNKSNLYPIKVSMALGWDTKYNINENMESILKKAEDYMYKNKLLESQAVKSKTIETVIESLYQKNLMEEDHSHRVGCLCEAFARVLDLDNTEIEQIRLLGTLHDIGKIAIDNNILDKPYKLSPYEFKEIERHSEIGYNILSSVNDLSQIANYVLTHHENFDGSGYPKNLKGKEIPLPSRIIKIIDAYDAMTQSRPYRAPLTIQVAISELKKYSGVQFDPELVEIFIRDVIRES